MSLLDTTFRRDIHGDTVAGTIFFVVTAVYFYQALQLPTPFSRGQAGPAFYPMILSLVMFICSITLVYRGIKKGDHGEVVIEVNKFVRPVIYTVITFGYILTLINVGYIVSTLIYTFLVTLLFEYGDRPTKRLLLFSTIVAIGVTILGHVFFEIIFNVRLPGGVLT